MMLGFILLYQLYLVVLVSGTKIAVAFATNSRNITDTFSLSAGVSSLIGRPHRFGFGIGLGIGIGLFGCRADSLRTGFPTA